MVEVKQEGRKLALEALPPDHRQGLPPLHPAFVEGVQWGARRPPRPRARQPDGLNSGPPKSGFLGFRDEISARRRAAWQRRPGVLRAMVPGSGHRELGA